MRPFPHKVKAINLKLNCHKKISASDIGYQAQHELEDFAEHQSREEDSVSLLEVNSITFRGALPGLPEVDQPFNCWSSRLTFSMLWEADQSDSLRMSAALTAQLS